MPRQLPAPATAASQAVSASATMSAAAAEVTGGPARPKKQRLQNLLQELETKFDILCWYLIEVRISNGKKLPIGEKNNMTQQHLKALGKKRMFRPNSGNTLSVCLKHIPDLYVVDFDTKELQGCELKEFLDREGVACSDSWSGKGYHYYCFIKNLPPFKNQQKIYIDKKFEIDLLKKNNCWEKRNVVLVGEVKVFDWEDLKQFFDVEAMNFSGNRRSRLSSTQGRLADTLFQPAGSGKRKKAPGHAGAKAAKRYKAADVSSADVRKCFDKCIDLMGACAANPTTFFRFCVYRFVAQTLLTFQLNDVTISRQSDSRYMLCLGNDKVQHCDLEREPFAAKDHHLYVQHGRCTVQHMNSDSVFECDLSNLEIEQNATFLELTASDETVKLDFAHPSVALYLCKLLENSKSKTKVSFLRIVHSGMFDAPPPDSCPPREMICSNLDKEWSNAFIVQVEEIETFISEQGCAQIKCRGKPFVGISSDWLPRCLRLPNCPSDNINKWSFLFEAFDQNIVNFKNLLVSQLLQNKELLQHSFWVFATLRSLLVNCSIERFHDLYVSTNAAAGAGLTLKQADHSDPVFYAAKIPGINDSSAGCNIDWNAACSLALRYDTRRNQKLCLFDPQLCIELATCLKQDNSKGKIPVVDAFSCNVAAYNEIGLTGNKLPDGCVPLAFDFDAISKATRRSHNQLFDVLLKVLNKVLSGATLTADDLCVSEREQSYHVFCEKVCLQAHDLRLLSQFCLAELLKPYGLECDFNIFHRQRWGLKMKLPLCDDSKKTHQLQLTSLDRYHWSFMTMLNSHVCTISISKIIECLNEFAADSTTLPDTLTQLRMESKDRGRWTEEQQRLNQPALDGNLVRGVQVDATLFETGQAEAGMLKVIEVLKGFRVDRLSGWSRQTEEPLSDDHFIFRHLCEQDANGNFQFIDKIRRTDKENPKIDCSFKVYFGGVRECSTVRFVCPCLVCNKNCWGLHNGNGNKKWFGTRAVEFIHFVDVESSKIRVDKASFCSRTKPGEKTITMRVPNGWRAYPFCNNKKVRPVQSFYNFSNLSAASQKKKDWTCAKFCGYKMNLLTHTKMQQTQMSSNPNVPIVPEKGFYANVRMYQMCPQVPEFDFKQHLNKDFFEK